MTSTRKILKRIKKLEIKTKQLVEGLLQGAYHSIFKGQGIEFAEVREYVYGDDIRSIDWNVTARMNHPYVKEFIEERDLNVLIVFDVSASSEFGSSKEKKEAAIELASSITFAAIHNNDNVGLAMFTDHVEKFIPLRKGKRHALKVIREMIYYKPKHKTSGLKNTLAYVSKVLKKRSIVFIVSDFMYENDYFKALSILKNRHDVIAVNMGDVREHEIPDIGYIELEDSETGEQLLVDTSDKEFRKSYTKLVNSRNKKWHHHMAKLRIDSIQLLSEQPYEIPLRKFFATRMRRWH